MSKNTQSWLVMLAVLAGMAVFTFVAFTIAKAMGPQ